MKFSFPEANKKNEEQKFIMTNLVIPCFSILTLKEKQRFIHSLMLLKHEMTIDVKWLMFKKDEQVFIRKKDMEIKRPLLCVRIKSTLPWFVI